MRVPIIALASILLANACAASGFRSEHLNRLAKSNDPYLLMHARDPVDWYPWGAEALNRAKHENKPIFLSIGYSSCYWCHIAQRTLYENPEIARLMNAYFINIKVDREERPDLDATYMDARLLITGSGGWPNNLFLTPDLKPFFAGSYYTASDAEGSLGFSSVLRSMHADWSDHRTDVLQQADLVFRTMRERSATTLMPPSFNYRTAYGRGITSILNDIDWQNGGIAGHTKFPREPTLKLLLADYAENHAIESLAAAKHWLEAMALGGFRDQLDGGFHRYSTEPTWSIPHFEKMLYDNAQLLSLYTEAYRVTGSPLFQQVALGVAGYLQAEMAAPGGGFFSSQDAEYAGQEGSSYLWSKAEITSIIGASQTHTLFDLYELISMPIDDDPIAAADEGVLRIKLALSPTSDGTFDASRIVAALSSTETDRRRLLAARSRKFPLARDEKVIVGWNAMAIGALMRAADVFQQPAYSELAREAAERIWRDAFRQASGRLAHEIINAKASGEGFAEDYALLADAYLTVADGTHEDIWSRRALTLTRALVERFYRQGPLSERVSSPDIIVKPFDTGDDTMPSARTATIELLLHLRRRGVTVGDANLESRVLSTVGIALDKHPERWPQLLAALGPTFINAPSDALVPAVGSIRSVRSADHVTAVGKLAHGAQIVVTVSIEPGFHLNANPASGDFLIPTELSILGYPNLQVHYPQGTLLKSAFATEGIQVLQGEVELSATLNGEVLPAGDTLYGELAIQACTDESCLPPDTLKFPIEREF